MPGSFTEYLVVEERDGGCPRERGGDLGARPLQGERLHLRHVAPEVEIVEEEAGVRVRRVDLDMGAGRRHVGGDAIPQAFDPLWADDAAQAHRAVVAIGVNFGLRRHHGALLRRLARV